MQFSQKNRKHKFKQKLKRIKLIEKILSIKGNRNLALRWGLWRTWG